MVIQLLLKVLITFVCVINNVNQIPPIDFQNPFIVFTNLHDIKIDTIDLYYGLTDFSCYLIHFCKIRRISLNQGPEMKIKLCWAFYVKLQILYFFVTNHLFNEVNLTRSVICVMIDCCLDYFPINLRTNHINYL